MHLHPAVDCPHYLLTRMVAISFTPGKFSLWPHRARILAMPDRVTTSA